MKKERKQASLFDALLCLGFLVTVLVTSLVFLKEYEISAHIPLLVGGIFTAGIAIFKLGFTWKELEEGILSTINTTMPSILILLIVGVLIWSNRLVPAIAGAKFVVSDKGDILSPK